MAEQDKAGAVTARQSTGSHIFAEFESLEGLNAPIRASARIKYTSIGVSRRYIALGASTGGLYIFHRESLRYLQVLTNKEGAVTKVVFAPDDNIVGFATSFGFVIAWELNIDKRDQPERIAISTAHRNVQVTCLQWDAASLRLFSGDNKGRVTQTNADARKVSGFFKMPTELLLTVESPIVQLDFADEKVLVSAQTKCVVCDTALKQQYTVGKKPRDGQFGGCFLQRAGIDFPAIYTGRPGSRVWEANLSGQVQATHQFKQLLAIPPLPVVGPSKEPNFVSEQKPQSFSFPVLLPMGSRFLLTWNDKGVFVFDPFAVDVVVWTSDIQGIVDAGCHKGQLYCLQESGRLHRYFLLSIERCIAKLFGQSLWHQCATLCTLFATRVTHTRARRHIPVSLVKELNYQLMDNTKDLDLIEQLEDLLDRIQSASPGSCSTTSSRRSSLESCDSVRLESGIYLIRNRHDSEDSFDGASLQGDDGAVTAVTLTVPGGPLSAAEGIQEGACSDDVFTSGHQSLSSDFPDVALEGDVRIPDGTDNDRTSHQIEAELSHHSRLTESDGITKDRADSQISLESASEINANTMQFKSKASTNIPNAPQLNSSTMIVSHDDFVNSTNSRRQWEDVELNEQISTPKLNQSVATSDRYSTHNDDDPSSRQIESIPSEDYTLQSDCVGKQLDDEDIASCSGPRITPSPEVEISQSMPPWKQSLEEQVLGNQPESCIGSNALWQDSVSSISGPTSHRSVPSSKSNNMPISTSTSSSSLNHVEDLPDEDEPPTLPPVPHSLRRTMSMPVTMVEAEMDPVVVRRRLSGMGDTVKEKKKKKKKRKSRIAEIGETPNRPVQSRLGSQATEDQPTSAISSEPVLDLPSEDIPSPTRSLSTPSSHLASSPSLSSATSISPRMHTSASSPRIPPASSPLHNSPPKPAPNSVPSYRSRSQHNLWDDSSSNVWQTSGSMLPTPPMMFVDLSAAQKLNLPSVGESISAMKESLSSTLTNAKSFLLNKMDSKEELHHSVSTPTFNLFFPEEDERRAERLQSLVQVGKEQKVHPAARALVAATGVARSRLEDPAVLYSPSESRKILKEWVQYLHAAVHQLYTEQPEVPPASEDTSPPDAPTASSEQSDVVDQVQTDSDGVQDETESHEQSARAESVCSEEPSATESVMTESQKDIDEKAASVDVAVTTTTSVNTSVRMSTTMTESNPSASPSSNKSFVGFLEKLGTGAHSMEIFDENRRYQEKVKSKDEMGDVCEDEGEDGLNMESVPDSILEKDNISISSDTVLTKTNAVSDESRRHRTQSEPHQSQSDAELTSLCFDSNQTDANERQIYCIKDPFSLPSEIHQEISELVVMCFEMGVYGDLKKEYKQDDLLEDCESGNDRTRPIFEVGQSEVEGQSHLNAADQSNVRNHQLGSPFFVPKRLLPSSQTEQPESDSQEKEASSVVMETDKDIVAAEFIKEYFHFMDMTKLRNVLGVRDGQRKKSFEVLISCLQEKYKDNAQLRKIDEAASDVGIDHLKTVAQKCPGLELCFATRIYEKSCEGGVKYMILTHTKLKPWEVLDIITARNDIPAGDFLTYVSGVLEMTPTSKRDSVLQSICVEPTMRLQLFLFALSHKIPAKGDLFCTCGEMPRPGSHKKDWSSQDLIHRILKLKSSRDVKQQMLQYCQKYGYWHGVLVLLQELNERPKALKLAVQLADLCVLSSSEDIQNSVIKVKNLEEWKIVLANVPRLMPCPLVRKNIEQLHCVDCNCVIWPKLKSQSGKSNSTSTNWSGGVCLTPEEPECDWSASESEHNPDWLTSALTTSEEVSDWLPTITWESVAVLLVQSVGAQIGVELLREAKVPEGALSKQFHQACIVSTILEKGQSNLSHVMLERVDTYLWSKRPITMAPSLYQLVKNETKQTVVRKSGEPASIEEQMELLGSFSLPEGESHFLEESDCHWGMHLNINSNCCVCGAPFYNSLPMAVQGVSVFTCGHMFHKLCIPEKVCVVCLENKVSISKPAQQIK